MYAMKLAAFIVLIISFSISSFAQTRTPASAKNRTPAYEKFSNEWLNRTNSELIIGQELFRAQVLKVRNLYAEKLFAVIQEMEDAPREKFCVRSGHIQELSWGGGCRVLKDNDCAANEMPCDVIMGSRRCVKVDEPQSTKRCIESLSSYTQVSNRLASQFSKPKWFQLGRGVAWYCKRTPLSKSCREFMIAAKHVVIPGRVFKWVENPVIYHDPAPVSVLDRVLELFTRTAGAMCTPAYAQGATGGKGIQQEQCQKDDKRKKFCGVSGNCVDMSLQDRKYFDDKSKLKWEQALARSGTDIKAASKEFVEKNGGFGVAEGYKKEIEEARKKMAKSGVFGTNVSREEIEMFKNFKEIEAAFQYHRALLRGAWGAPMGDKKADEEVMVALVMYYGVGMYAYMQYPVEERDLKVNDKSAPLEGTDGLRARSDSGNNVEFANRVTRDIQEHLLSNPGDIDSVRDALAMIESAGRSQKEVDLAALEPIKNRASPQMRQYIKEAAMVSDRVVREKTGQLKAVVDKIKQGLDTSGNDMIAIGDDQNSEGVLKELMRRCQETAATGSVPGGSTGPGNVQGR